MLNLSKWILIILGAVGFAAGMRVWKQDWVETVISQQVRTHLKKEVRWDSCDLRRGTLSLQNVRLYNPNAEGGQLVMQAPYIYLKLEPWALLKGKIHFQKASIAVQQLHLIHGQDSPSLLEVFQSKTKGGSQGIRFTGVDRLELSVGTLTARDLKEPDKTATLTGKKATIRLSDVRNANDFKPFTRFIMSQNPWRELWRFKQTVNQKA